MSPTEFAKLLMRPVSKVHTKFFADRISIGMSYHSGQNDILIQVRGTEAGKMQFTPRLYTSDTYGLSMLIKDFENIENYQTFGACFFSQSTLSEVPDGTLHQTYNQNKEFNLFFTIFCFRTKYAMAH